VKRHVAVAVVPNLFADALTSVLAEDEVDEVVDLTLGEDDRRRFDIAVVSPGHEEPDADIVIVLPPSGVGEVAVVGAGSRVHVEVRTVDELFDLLDEYCPSGRPRRRPFG
jgi:hypothetical protein